MESELLGSSLKVYPFNISLLWPSNCRHRHRHCYYYNRIKLGYLFTKGRNRLITFRARSFGKRQIKVSLGCTLKVDPFDISLSWPSYCYCGHRHRPFYYYNGIKLGYSYSLKPSNSNLVMVLQLRACATAPDPKWILHSKNVPSCAPTKFGRKNLCKIFPSCWLTLAVELCWIYIHIFFPFAMANKHHCMECRL